MSSSQLKEALKDIERAIEIVKVHMPVITGQDIICDLKDQQAVLQQKLLIKNKEIQRAKEVLLKEGITV